MFRLDINLYFTRSMLDGDLLPELKELLGAQAPDWSSGLRLASEDRENINISDLTSETLVETIRKYAMHRGPLFDQLTEHYGGDARLFGTAEIRGKFGSLIVVISVDEQIFNAIAGRWLLGNYVSIQVCEATVEKQDAAEWASRTLEMACGAMSPLYASAHMSAERLEKNMDREGGTMKAVGVDISRYLPGTYWANFFGKPYRDLIGGRKLLSSPAWRTMSADEGVLIYLHEDPEAWGGEEYHATEQAVLEHIGREYFFDKNDLNRETKAPDFGLPDLARNPRFY